MSLRENFGKNLKYYRFEKGLKQEALAELINIASPYLSEVESGLHTLDFDKIELACKVLNIEPFQLFLEPKKVKLPRRVDMYRKD